MSSYKTDTFFDDKIVDLGQHVKPLLDNHMNVDDLDQFTELIVRCGLSTLPVDRG